MAVCPGVRAGAALEPDPGGLGARLAAAVAGLEEQQAPLPPPGRVLARQPRGVQPHQHQPSQRSESEVTFTIYKIAVEYFTQTDSCYRPQQPASPPSGQVSSHIQRFERVESHHNQRWESSSSFSSRGPLHAPAHPPPPPPNQLQSSILKQKSRLKPTSTNTYTTVPQRQAPPPPKI